MANEINYTTNFLDEISHIQIGSICESVSVKALICKGRLQNFIVTNCVNGKAEYSSVDVRSQNEWINKIFDCVLHKSGTCKLEDGVDIVNVTTTTLANIVSEQEETAVIEDSTTIPSTTTYSTTSSFTTTPEHIAVYTHDHSEQSNSYQIKPIFSILLIAMAIAAFM